MRSADEPVSRSARSARSAIARILALLLLPLLIGLASAGPAWSASGAEAETRLKQLSEELRCLVCQNQTLADSNAELAVDLRNQVKAMIEQGQSDEQIKTYLVDRYGQFVLYKPPVQRSTWLLWGGPFALLLIGLLIWSRVGRRPPPTAQAGARADSDAGASPSATGADSHADAELDAARRLLDDR
ncbi:MAG: cytochrome c-type biogenesis protein CcmH [Burkholderiaceae bacterium]